jgi:Carbohydrate family 9 binding domain-like
VRLLWDDTNLYVFGEIAEADVVGGFDDKTKKIPKADDTVDSPWTIGGQPKLWTKDTLEVMIDPGPSGDNKNYFELQFNPQGKVFHAQFDDFRNPLKDPNGPFGHEDWDPKLKSAVVVHGTLDKPGDQDQGYDVEIAIPWTAFAKNPAKAPPADGDFWRMNFYGMKNGAVVAWSPTLKEGFHRASRFGRIRFGAPPPPPAPPAFSGAMGGHPGRPIPRMRVPGSMPASPNPP